MECQAVVQRGCGLSPTEELWSSVGHAWPLGEGADGLFFYTFRVLKSCPAVG